MEQRKCNICKIGYPLINEFFHNVKAKYFNGFSYTCKKCNSNREKLRNRYKDRKEYHKNFQKKWDINNPEKVYAKNEVMKAVKSGVIERKNCEKCGNTKSLGHHSDYSKPLDVIWLCAKCHRLLHESLKVK